MKHYIWTDGCGYVTLPMPYLAVEEICQSGRLHQWLHLADYVIMDDLLSVHKDIMGYETCADNARDWLIFHAAWDCFDNPSFYAEKPKNILKEVVL